MPIRYSPIKVLKSNETRKIQKQAVTSFDDIPITYSHYVYY